MHKTKLLIGLLLIAVAFSAGALAAPAQLRPQPTQAQQAEPEPQPIPSTPEMSICQDPYYQVSAGPNEPTVCALKDGYTDCHNFTAVPNGQACDPATAPQPYVEPKPVTKCEGA